MLTNWTYEFQKRTLNVRSSSYKGLAAESTDAAERYSDGPVPGASYGVRAYHQRPSELVKMRCVPMIIDEGHLMRNANIKLTQTLSKPAFLPQRAMRRCWSQPATCVGAERDTSAAPTIAVPWAAAVVLLLDELQFGCTRPDDMS
ncbi:hypothetical protein EXIGLDRAFT_842614 [Exidia glandulosa HHB12029]|uniref:Uncharacterized protein n=1 Tax=Exidia glandulosa HHB12029 TaxID=1314781 RepID=A0A165D6N6_EXIGL|nr:hypothetical protein EXIGLDRAFT_842614 [Exidia glandulosa HHB12029]